MSYHPLAHGFFRRPMSGLGGDVSASVGVPGEFIAAGRYAGGLLDKYNGRELLNSLVTAYRTPGQSQDVASVISREVVNKGTAAGCAAVGAAATGLLGAGGPLVGIACGKIAGAINAEMNRPRPTRQYIEPGAFHAELVGKAQASCAPGDTGCKKAVAAEVAAFTTGDISPLRIWNLWAQNLCMSCSSGFFGKSCKLADDPACAYDEGLVWDEAMTRLTQNVAKAATASRLKAEGDFARATVAAAQAVKPQFYPLCGGDATCVAKVDTGIDLAAMNTALAMRTSDETAALDRWATELANIENDAREAASQNVKIAQAQAQGNAAEAARIKAEGLARTAASKAKYAARTKERLAAEKSDKRKRVVGAAVLAVALGTAVIMANKKRRQR